MTCFRHCSIAGLAIAVSAILTGPLQAAEYQEFPDGFGWPADPETIQKAIDNGDLSAVRDHGWRLWAGLNTTGDDDTPVWATWPTSTQVFAGPAPDVVRRNSRHLRALRASSGSEAYINQPGPGYVIQEARNGECVDSDQDSLADGKRFQFNGDIMVAGVIYNQPAMDWNRRSEAPLYQAEYLTEQWKDETTSIESFPARAMVLKHMYWPIQGDKPTALPVWDPDQYDPDPPRYIGYEYWNRVVAVDPAYTAAGKAEVSFLYHINKSRKADKPDQLPTRTVEAQLVDLNDFYHRRIDASEWESMDAADQAILTTAACWLYDRPFQAGDYLATVAMHINTKEIPQWALQSLWWHDQPDQGRFSADRPDIPRDKAPGPWRHYLMTTSYGIPEGDGDLPVSYNPYIELAAEHPINTNCRNCHIRAAWPPGDRDLGQTRSASYLADPGPGPMADLKSDDPVFKDLMLMDFQWSTVDRALPVPEE